MIINIIYVIVLNNDAFKKLIKSVNNSSWNIYLMIGHLLNLLILISIHK